MRRKWILPSAFLVFLALVVSCGNSPTIDSGSIDVAEAMSIPPTSQTSPDAMTALDTPSIASQTPLDQAIAEDTQTTDSIPTETLLETPGITSTAPLPTETLPEGSGVQPTESSSENLPVLESSLQPTIEPSQIGLSQTSLITETALQVVTGEKHSCVLTDNNEVKCWGNDYYGQLGIGQNGVCSHGGTNIPLRVNGLNSEIYSIAAGWNQTCAFTKNGLMCWGRNHVGQLGDGTYTERCQPVFVNGLPADTTDIAIGGYHACARTGSSEVWCWGSNARGQLGIGTSGGNSPAPVKVSGLNQVISISAGAWHTCALLEDGKVKCWGDNSYGQSGDGKGGYGVYSTIPVEVKIGVQGSNTGVTGISAGGIHTCALVESGEVLCWGDNDYGQMGNGKVGGFYSIPIRVSQLGKVHKVYIFSAGDRHTCAITEHLGVLCWGFNYYGQLGNGEHASYGLAPSSVIDLGCGVKDIDGGEHHTCAITYSGYVKCWGRNQEGQLGNGIWFDEYTPDDVVGFEEPHSFRICGYVWDARQASKPKKLYNVIISSEYGQKTTTNPFNWWFETGTHKLHYGGYCLCRLTPASYRLTANKKGWSISPSPNIIHLLANEDAGLKGSFLATPAKTFRVSGRVKDIHGNPVKGVRIETDEGDVFITDAQGGYTFELTEGEAVIRPSLGGYTFSPDPLTITVDDHMSGQDFEATPSPPVTRASQALNGGQRNGDSNAPSLSADGRYVAFASTATNLVRGDDNVFCNYMGYGYPPSNCPDIFVYDRKTGDTTLVSISSSGAQADGESNAPSISADGRFVAFTSDASNLVEDDTNNLQDVFVHDLVTGLTLRASVASDGAQANGSSGHFLSSQPGPSISADGRLVAFSSVASNLVESDTNGKRDIFVHDLQTGETRRVSVNSAGQQVYDHSDYPVISADGRFVVFESDSIHLVNGDTNGHKDVFIHDLHTGQTALISNIPAEEQYSNHCNAPVISTDGRYVAYVCGINPRIFLHDRQTGQTKDILDNLYASTSAWLSISADGRYVVFTSDYAHLVGGDTNQARDVFLWDSQTKYISRLSLDSNGVQGNEDTIDWVRPAISADGLIVAFASKASNLVPNDDELCDIFVSERPSWNIYQIYLPLAIRN